MQTIFPVEVQRLDALSRADLDRVMNRAHGSFDEIMPLIEGIFSDVKARGDAALRAFTARFDGAELADLRVTDAEFEAARAATPPELMRALEQAARNVAAFHRTHIAEESRVQVQDGVTAWRVWRPSSSAT